jgi:hypothetical protein
VPPRRFDYYGFAEPTPDFVRVTVGPDGDRAMVDGVAVIPDLPVCRVRVKTDAGRVAPHAPGRAALVAAVRAALHEEVVVELHWN